MKLLLDTHAFLWFVLDDVKLSEKQALTEKIPLVSKDVQLNEYSISRIW